MGCDWCDEGNVAVDGWHYVTDDEDEALSFRIACVAREEED